MSNTQLITKISLLPDDLKSEVSKFIDALVERRKRETKKKKPQFGSANGKIIMSPDFDAPIDDFKEYME